MWGANAYNNSIANLNNIIKLNHIISLTSLGVTTHWGRCVNKRLRCICLVSLMYSSWFDSYKLP